MGLKRVNEDHRCGRQPWMPFSAAQSSEDRGRFSRRSFIGLAGTATAAFALQGPGFLLSAWADEAALEALDVEPLPNADAEEMSEETLDVFDSSLADVAWKGTGSKATPYLIENASQLYGLALAISDAGGKETFAGKHFAQTANIDLASFKWIPIGNGEAKQVFRGDFDGRGHVISNLHVDGTRTGEDAHVAGLFGSLGSKAQVRNVILENATVIIQSIGLSVYASYVGGIAGFVAADAVLKNCSARVSVDVQIRPAKNDSRLGAVYAGGIAGYCKGSMQGCLCEKSSVKLNYAYEGSQSKNLVGCAGALAGRNEGTLQSGYARSVEVSACCAHVQHASFAGVGGIAGTCAGGRVENCYAAQVDASASSVTSATVGGKTYSSAQGGTLAQGYLSGGFDAASTLTNAYFDESLGPDAKPAGEAAGSVSNVIQFTGTGEGTLKQRSSVGNTSDLLDTLNAWVETQQAFAFRSWLRDGEGYPAFAQLLPVDFWGTLTFAVSQKDGQTPFYFSESLFAGSAFKYNPQLSTLSLCLAMSGFGSLDVDYPEKSRNVRKFFGDIGALDVEVNEWFTKKPTQQSIACAVGHRLVSVGAESYELVAVAVRGAGYELEWCSNVLVGKTGDHNGFNEAAGIVIDFLRDYLKRHVANLKATNLKLWVSGFSRAAATSNLVGARLNKAGVASGDTALGRDLSLAIGDGSLTLYQSNSYIYCMEAPAGAYLPDAASRESAKSDHLNIHSIINPCDLVPRVAPSALNFGRYGTDMVLPAPAKWKDYQPKRDVMLPFLFDINNENTTEYVLDKAWTAGCGTLDVFLAGFFDTMTREQLKTRENFAANFQAAIIDTLAYLMGAISVSAGGWVSIIARLCWYADPTAYLPAISRDVCVHWDWKETPILFSKWLVQAAKDTGYDISGHEKQIEHLLHNMLGLVGKYALYHFRYFGALLSNVGGGYLFPAHYPELCLAWLRAMDPNYADDPIEVPAPGASQSAPYRIVRINGAVDVSVENPDGTVVSVFANEQALPPDECGFVVLVNPDGEKQVCVPSDESCMVVLTGREDAVYGVAVNDYDSSMGSVVQVVNYYDVGIKQGERNFLDMPMGQKCVLRGGDKVTEFDIGFFEDNVGAIEKVCYFSAEPTANDPTLGMVLGGGMRIVGAYVLLLAEPFDDNRFDGWWMDGVKVSESSEYRIRMTGDAAPVACFAKPDDPNPPVPGPVPNPKPLAPTGDKTATIAAAAAAVGAVAAGAVAATKVKGNKR